MVSALDSRSKGPGSSPSWGHSGQGTFLSQCNGLASHPGGVAILLVTSWYRNRDNLQLCGALELACVQTLPYFTAFIASVVISPSRSISCG